MRVETHMFREFYPDINASVIGDFLHGRIHVKQPQYHGGPFSLSFADYEKFHGNIRDLILSRRAGGYPPPNTQTTNEVMT